MTVTQRLYEAARRCGSLSQPPFVRGIGDGTLELEKFRHFCSRTTCTSLTMRWFAYGVVKARDPDLMRTFAANVDASWGAR